MGDYYRHVGFVDQSSRPERVEVEAPTADNPEGKVLVLNGDAKELNQEQVTTLSRFIRLEKTDAPGGVLDTTVDQPLVEQPSLSTDGQTGTSPDFDDPEVVKQYLKEHDVSGRSSKDQAELRQLAVDHFNTAQEG